MFLINGQISIPSTMAIQRPSFFALFVLSIGVSWKFHMKHGCIVFA